MTTQYELFISMEVSMKRQAAVDFARGSVRLEGIVLSPEIEDINQQYIRGHIEGNRRRTLFFTASEREFGALSRVRRKSLVGYSQSSSPIYHPFTFIKGASC